MKPKVREVNGLLHLRYSFPQQIHTSCVYPLPSPNGSSVVICGHENGLLLLWRGGRPFKHGRGNDARLQQSEIRTIDVSQDVMAIDESEPGSSLLQRAGSSSFRSHNQSALDAEFEKQPDEIPPQQPYWPIIQDLDLPMGTAVHHIAFPPVPFAYSVADELLSPRLLQEKIVLALGCEDCSVRLLTIPLCPPSPASKSRKSLREDISLCMAGSGSWGEELVVIPNPQGQQSLLKGVSVAIAPRSAIQDDDQTEEDEDEDIEREGDEAEGGASNKSSEAYEVLLASHSSALSGMLSVHRISISSSGSSIHQPQNSLPWRLKRLSSPAATIDLFVSPMSEHATPRIAVAEQYGAVKIFECSTSSHPSSGSWSLTLHPGFGRQTHGIASSRELLGARWAVNGNAIIVLTADGEWGIWNLLPTKGPKGALTGSIPTKFTSSGWISSPEINRLSQANSSGTLGAMVDSKSSGSLAPMTPGTRRTQKDSLFSSMQQSKTSVTSTVASRTVIARTPQRGGLSVNLMNASVTGRGIEETLLIWYGQRILSIPCLRAHVKARLGALDTTTGSGPERLGLGGGPTSGQMREIGSADFSAGELCTGASLFAPPSPALAAYATLSTLRAPRPDLLISGDRSIKIVAARIEEPDESAIVASPPPIRKVDRKTLQQMKRKEENGMGAAEYEKSSDNEEQGRMGREVEEGGGGGGEEEEEEEGENAEDKVPKPVFTTKQYLSDFDMNKILLDSQEMGFNELDQMVTTMANGVAHDADDEMEVDNHVEQRSSSRVRNIRSPRSRQGVRVEVPRFRAA